MSLIWKRNFRMVIASTLVFSSLVFGSSQFEAEQWYQEIVSLPETQKSLSKIERQKVFTAAVNHKVASMDMLWKYDPTGEIGFCFGRAMAVHLIARRQGLAESSIRKLFIIGDLRSGEAPEWRFHVTTLVKGNEGNWYAIDPLMTPPLAAGTPLSVQGWIEIVQATWDRQHRARFYQVSARSVMPDVREMPDVGNEKGRFIIELKFNPQFKSGFTEADFSGHLYYNLSETAETDYFMQVKESHADSFPFEALQINQLHFPFRNYFFDLLGSLLPG
jgi:hypothetical protein